MLRLTLTALLLLCLPLAAQAGPFQPRGRDKETAQKESEATPPDAAKPDEQPQAAAPPEAAQHPSQNASPPIPLRPNLRMVIRPTILGLVPNRDPDGYGELFARVMASDAGRVQLYFEVKELSPRNRPKGSWLASLNVTGATDAEGGAGHAPGSAEHDPQELTDAEGVPQQRALTLADFGHLIEDTRIRRGDLFFSGVDSAPMASPPLFWGDGLWQASGSGIWLSRALLAQLKSAGEAPWQRFEMAGPPPGGAPPEAARLIVVSATAKYPCVVNGARVMLPALYCRDSLGLAEYWIHDDPANPLLLKLSFLPPAGMKPIESIVELDESDAPGDGRDPRLPKLLVRRPGDDEAAGGDSPQPYHPGSNQFGGQPRPAPPDVGVSRRLDEDGEEIAADEDVSGADSAAGADQGERRDAGIDTGAAAAQPLPGAPSADYLPPSIDELVACGGGYAIVEIDF